MSWKRRDFSLSPFLLFLSFFLFLFFFTSLPFLPQLNICIWGIKNKHVWRECITQPAAASIYPAQMAAERAGGWQVSRSTVSQPRLCTSWGFPGDSLQSQQMEPIAHRSHRAKVWVPVGRGLWALRVPAAISPADPLPPQWFICWPRNGLYSSCCLCHVCPWEKTTQKAENLKNKERKGEKREEKCLLNTWRSGERKCFSFQFKCMFPRFPFSYISPHWALNVCTVLFLFLCFLFLLGPDVLVHCSTKQRGTQQRSPSIILWSSPWALGALPKITAWKRLLQATVGSSSLTPPCHGFIVHL